MQLISTLRLDYTKELEQLRETLRKRYHAGVSNEYAEVRFFESTNTIDENTKYILNEKIADLKRVYDEIVHKQLAKLTDYQRKICIFEKLCEDGNVLVNLDELNAEDMAKKLKIVEDNPAVLWDAFNAVFGPAFFNKVIEEKLLGN
mmetsp:Transcript_4388/g.4146  ORF Transcript_4388/g.4146 Transcript_4388/m.4146 type:complete len:146 (+) Transcript_4388:853-1290(+)